MLNNSYINEPKLGGGKSFEKALTAKIMHNFKGGEVCDYAQLETALEKRSIESQAAEPMATLSHKQEAALTNAHGSAPSCQKRRTSKSSHENPSPTSQPQSPVSNTGGVEGAVTTDG